MMKLLINLPLIKNSKTLLLIFLTVATSACQTRYPKTAPPVPKVNVRQTLYQQVICPKDCTDPNVCDCKVINRCDEYKMNSKGNWDKVLERNIKDCNGVLGVTGKDYTEILDYSRKMTAWMTQNCKMD